MKLRVFLALSLLAAFPVVFLAAENPGEGIRPEQVIASLSVAIIGAVLLTLFLKLFIKDDAKVYLAASLLILVFFSYGHVFAKLSVPMDYLFGYQIGGHQRLLPAAAVLTLVGLWFILRLRGAPTYLITGITLGALILVLVNAGRIGVHAFGDGDGGADEPLTIRTQERSVGEQLPDIYYIILDGYGREDVLKEVYGFDNSEFLDALREMGFYVAAESRANYIHTKVSIPITLHMRYHYSLESHDISVLPDLHSNRASYVARVAEALAIQS